MALPHQFALLCVRLVPTVLLGLVLLPRVLAELTIRTPEQRLHPRVLFALLDGIA